MEDNIPVKKKIVGRAKGKKNPERKRKKEITSIRRDNLQPVSAVKENICN